MIYLSGYANEGERGSKRRGEGMLVKGPHSVIINYDNSFGVKKWKGVGVPTETYQLGSVIINILFTF